MDNKHTFWTLLNAYDKIEVPIIQRDYAQGRETSAVKRIRESFVNDYLLDALLKGERVELDFVYGSTLDRKAEADKVLFIPLDGQQRLTTLYLLHWFIALKENKMYQAREILERFTYETRPSAHDFCVRLIRIKQSDDLRGIRQQIMDAEWYDDEWDNDPTIRGMLTMIHTFATHRGLSEHADGLFAKLTDPAAQLISFYFIPLEQFGLTENLYIRMNARGKMLTPFEHFKSEFYDIISYDHELLEQVKDKIEYQWVENLWDHKEADTYVIDKPFMRLLEFVSQMLYFKAAQFRAAEYEEDFLDFRLLRTIYSNEENLRFLVFTLDHIELFQRYDTQTLLWSEETTISAIFRKMIGGQSDILRYMILYATIRYYFLGMPGEHFPDLIRVIRNLLENTADKSIREWPRLLASIDHLMTSDNVYDLLLQSGIAEKLEGFYLPQRREEIFKAKIIASVPAAKELFFKAENNVHLRGNITPLIAANFESSTGGVDDFDILKADPAVFDIDVFGALFRSYHILLQDDLKTVRGDLILSSLYTQSIWQRLMFDNNYAKNGAVIMLAKDHSLYKRSADIEDFLRDRERRFIRELAATTTDLSEVRDVKEQLYLYYILHRRIAKKGISTFFANGYNFGWLAKETGYVSNFKSGIANDHWYGEKNPIFQTYKTQFRYNLGLKAENALPQEVVGSERKKKPFDQLIAWANEQ